MSRIRTNIITNRMANGAPTVSNGLVISGVTTTSDIKVGTNIILTTTGNGNFSGIVTATTFSGSGASLTNLNASNIASGTVPTARLGSGTANSSTFLAGDSTFKTITGTTINNNADNRVITGSGTANTLEGESNLTFDGTNLIVTGNIFPTGNIQIDDSTSGGNLYIGNNSDLKLFHNGSTNFIRSGADGHTIQIDNNSGVVGAKFIPAGAVELYHNGSKKFHTFSEGVTLFGDGFFDNPINAGKDLLWDASQDRLEFKDNVSAVFGDSADLKIYHNQPDNNSYITESGTGSLLIQASRTDLLNAAGSEFMLTALQNGAVSLYYDNTKRFETTSDGVKISGDLRFDSPPTVAISLPDDKRIYFGNSNDLVIWHSPNNNSYIKNITGELFLASDNIALKTADQSETFIDCNGNGNVELYHDNTKQCETSANGLAFPSGKGIDFSADASGTLKTLPNSFNAEVLHDYEVGTFVPNISYDTGTNQYYGSVGSGQNVASAKGEYIRIGDLVSFAGEITLTGNRSSTQNVHISIGGLPYNGLHSSEQSSLMTGWGGAAWPKNDSNPSYRLIYAWHAYTTLNFYFYQAAGNNGIDGFRFHGYYRCAP